MTAISTGFVAYPSNPPSVRDVLTDAVPVINKQHAVSISTWEDLPIGGRQIIDEICHQIDRIDLFIADLTGLNLNVLYELGYAIARAKRIWLLFDPTFKSTTWSDFRLLSSVGYRPSTNSDMVKRWYDSDRPHLRETTLFDELIQPSLSAQAARDSLLYLKSSQETNASSRMSQRIEASSMPSKVDDPREVPSQPLSWYVERVASASGILCHFDNPERNGPPLRNAAVAFVAGLAHGLGKNVLLLGEGRYLSPLDYRDRMRSYQTASAAQDAVDAWLSPLEELHFDRRAQITTAAEHKRLYNELAGIRLGEYIAENEEQELVDGYFVETVAYEEALRGQKQAMLFVGRKGAGKSANYLKLASRFAADKANYVCEVKPPSYELSSLMELLGRFAGRDSKQYIVEGIWRFLLYSEVANKLGERIEGRPVQTWRAGERELVDYRRNNREIFEGDFAVRVESCVERLRLAQPLEGESLASFRDRVGTVFYSAAIGELKKLVSRAMLPRSRICVLVDNLDKAWDRKSDLAVLAEFLLGLLTAANKIGYELGGELSHGRSRLTLSVFLRADIFDRIRAVAREPDKIEHQRLEWDDDELLLRLVDERFEAFQGSESFAGELFTKYFCATIDDVPAKEFILRSILPRPRDLLFLLRSAIASAVNRRHMKVEAADVHDAVRRYSEFAFDVLRIEDSSYEEPLSDLLIHFVGKPAILSATEIDSLLSEAGRGPVPGDAVHRLCVLSFLKIEVRRGEFVVADDEKSLEKALVLARNHAAQHTGDIRYQIHPAFRPYLEVG